MVDTRWIHKSQKLMSLLEAAIVNLLHPLAQRFRGFGLLGVSSGSLHVLFHTGWFLWWYRAWCQWYRRIPMAPVISCVFRQELQVKHQLRRKTMFQVHYKYKHVWLYIKKSDIYTNDRFSSSQFNSNMFAWQASNLIISKIICWSNYSQSHL